MEKGEIHEDALCFVVCEREGETVKERREIGRIKRNKHKDDTIKTPNYLSNCSWKLYDLCIRKEENMII